MTVAVIPARGGSRGLLRKNLQLLAGVPLVARTVRAALDSKVDRVIVSTDDPEIAAVAKHSGGEAHERPEHLSGPETTVAEVVADVAPDGPVVVLQPSSPFTDGPLIDAVIAAMEGNDSAATVTAIRHGAWTKQGPLHEHPVNRQYASPHAWLETGAVQAVQSFPANGGPVKGAPLVGGSHVLFDPAEEMGVSELQAQRYALDIDTPADLAVAQHLAGRGTVLFSVTAGRDTGTGHLHRCLTIADALTGHTAWFSSRGEQATWANEQVERRGYEWRSPHPWEVSSVVVFDCLEYVTVDTVLAAQAAGAKVVVLECLDPSVTAAADLAVNSLYSGPGLTGAAWEPLRPEFTIRPPREEHEDVRFLVSFGGTDPSRLSERFGQLCQAVMSAMDGLGTLRVLWPPGRERVPVPFSCWEGSVSEALAWADIAVTSAGRTVIEAAAMGCPVVAVAAHEREELHAPLPGVAWMGHHAQVTNEAVGGMLLWLAANPSEREARAARAYGSVDPAGATARLADLIDRMVRG